MSAMRLCRDCDKYQPKSHAGIGCLYCGSLIVYTEIDPSDRDPVTREDKADGDN